MTGFESGTFSNKRADQGSTFDEVMDIIMKAKLRERSKKLHLDVNKKIKCCLNGFWLSARHKGCGERTERHSSIGWFTRTLSRKCYEYNHANGLGYWCAGDEVLPKMYADGLPVWFAPDKADYLIVPGAGGINTKVGKIRKCKRGRWK